MQNHKEMDPRVAMHAGPAQCTHLHGLQDPKFEKLEQEASDLEVEKHKLSKQVESLKSQVYELCLL